MACGLARGAAQFFRGPTTEVFIFWGDICRTVIHSAGYHENIETVMIKELAAQPGHLLPQVFMGTTCRVEALSFQGFIFQQLGAGLEPAKL